MSEEIENEKVEEVVVAKFDDYIGSQEYINHMNAQKGTWAEDFRKKESEKIRLTEREVLLKELKPEETPEQKEIRELREMIQNKEKKEQQVELERSLRNKAKELGADTDLAELYSRFDAETAETEMVKAITKMNAYITSEIDKKIKGTFDTKIPVVGGENQKVTINQLKGMSREEIKVLTDKGLIEGL